MIANSVRLDVRLRDGGLKISRQKETPKDNNTERLTVELYIDIYIEKLCGSDSQCDVKRSPSGQVMCHVVTQNEKRGWHCRIGLPNNSKGVQGLHSRGLCLCHSGSKHPGTPYD